MFGGQHGGAFGGWCWVFHEGYDCVCDQGYTRGSMGQREWFLLTLLLVHIAFASNADDEFSVSGEGWWDWIGCGNGISEYCGFVVISWDEL